MIHPPSKKLFSTKNDPEDMRLGDGVNQVSEKSATRICLIGYPDDEGIVRNSGRPGAALGPNAIRKQLYKMTPPIPWGDYTKLVQLTDLGNLDVESLSLEQRHEFAKDLITRCGQDNPCTLFLTLGGGHDYGYPDAAAFLEVNKGSKLQPLVINIDAHLDVRPTNKGFSSGTGFYRLLTGYDHFTFIELGIQEHCNSVAHKTWCESFPNAHVYTWEQIIASGHEPRDAILKFLAPFLTESPQRPCFLSVDIDGFASPYAMGCSQSWPTGFAPEDIIALIKTLSAETKFCGLGLYEVSPPLDSDERTAKLAALLAYKFITQKLGGSLS